MNRINPVIASAAAWPCTGSTNVRAIRLYERLGFAHEGVRRRARKLDGGYDDNVLMALVTS